MRTCFRSESHAGHSRGQQANEPEGAIPHRYGFKTHVTNVTKRQKSEGICGNKIFLKTHCLS